jgi:hypothetical protein
VARHDARASEDQRGSAQKQVLERGGKTHDESPETAGAGMREGITGASGRNGLDGMSEAGRSRSTALVRWYPSI